MNSTGRIVAGALVIGGLTGAAAASEDVHDLNRGFPLEVEDTLTSEQGRLELEASARCEHTGDGADMGFEYEF